MTQELLQRHATANSCAAAVAGRAGAGDDDDDAPPPLAVITDQLHAAQLSTSIVGTAGLKASGQLRTAAVTDSAGQQAPVTAAAAPAKQQQPFKRGFLVGASSRSKQPAAAEGRSRQKGLTTLTGQQQQQEGGTKAIPDFLRVPLSEQEQARTALRSQLLAALQPTPETVSVVSSDPTLMSGFDDPEVMAAVAEVARDPAAFAKHARNPKVQRFYEAFGGLMSGKLGQCCAGAAAAAAKGGGAAAGTTALGGAAASSSQRPRLD